MYVCGEPPSIVYCVDATPDVASVGVSVTCTGAEVPAVEAVRRRRRDGSPSSSAAMLSSTSAKVPLPVTLVNTTRPFDSVAVAPLAGAPSCHTTCPSMAIVGEVPSSGIETVPQVPAGADIVSANELCRVVGASARRADRRGVGT